MNCVTARLAALVLAIATTLTSAAQSVVETGTPPPPEGRPPQGALARTESRKWEIKLSLELPSIHKDGEVSDALHVPVSLLDTWWQVDPRTFRAKVRCDSVPVPALSTPLVVAQNRFGDSFVEIPLPSFIESRIYAEVSWIVEVWSCQLDEQAAAQIRWPTAWPQEVQRWQRASEGLDPDNPQIQALRQQLVQSISNRTPPIYAAKEIIRAGSRALRNGDHREGQTSGFKTRGIAMWGLAQSLTSQIGSEADVTCICVALLRSFGFPARLVIGVTQNSRQQANAGPSERLTLWGEVFLPELGWVPFDPEEIRGGVSATHAVDLPWNGFGSDSHQDERVPISHELDIYSPKASDPSRTASFAAPARLKSKLEQPGQGPTDILIQTLIVSRGRGRGGS